MTRCRLLTVIFTATLCGSAGSQTADQTKELRERVLKTLKGDSSRNAGKAYEAYFQKLGNEGLKDLVKDKDTSIALQAAWEVNKKAIRRAKPLPNRTDDIYDPDELAKFAKILKERVKAQLPEWWAAGIVEIELFPGSHHASGEAFTSKYPKLKKSKSGKGVADKAELIEAGDMLKYTTMGVSFEFPKALFDSLIVGEWVVSASGKKQTALAGFSPGSGGPAFLMAGFDNNDGKLIWKADVWAAGRTLLGGYSSHRVEIVEKEGTFFVFGAESHGMYVEAFDAATGKCQFRFCSCYWFHFSEEWGKK